MNGTDFRLKALTPIFRIFDEEKAKEFYLDFLEFKQDWEHRFEQGTPLYTQISKGDCIIHLSEHHGDACPGSSIRVEVENIEALHAKLIGKNYKYYRPGLETTPWNTLEVGVTDPFGNRVLFFQNIS